ncbi:MAG: hypothetical protein WBI53_07635 [Paludibacter sp.]
MHTNFIKIFYILILILLVSACSDIHEYRVEEEFTKYVQRFEMEAAKRGKDFDLQNTGLIVEFADLKDEQAGLCHYEKPIRIEIDRAYWKAISATAGADLMKENLLFHELGHGMLGRDHLNTTLENGDWKSIMCGGEKVNDRPWNINYRGIRRNYYVDELFNESAPEPDFSTMQFSVDTSGFERQIFLGFDNNANSVNVSDNESYSISVDNNRLKFQSKIDYSYFIYLVKSVDILSDFLFETDIQCQSKNTTDQYGIILENYNSSSEDVEFFSVNNDSKMYMGNRSWYSFYTQISRPEIKKGGINKLKILKKATMLYYFINDVYVYCSEMELTGSQVDFGFIVPAKGIVWLDNLQIRQNSSNKINYISKEFNNFTFRVQPVNDLRSVPNR